MLTDGQPLQVDELKNIKKLAQVGDEDKGKPYQVGFTYDLAEPEHRGWYTGELQRIFALDADSSNSTKNNCQFYVRVKGNQLVLTSTD